MRCKPRGQAFVFAYQRSRCVGHGIWACKPFRDDVRNLLYRLHVGWFGLGLPPRTGTPARLGQAVDCIWFC